MGKVPGPSGGPEVKKEEAKTDQIKEEEKETEEQQRIRVWLRIRKMFANELYEPERA